MNGRTSVGILRRLPRAAARRGGASPSPSSRPSFIDAIREVPRPRAPSRRAMSSIARSSTAGAALRTALACEASSLRYALLLQAEGEGPLARGWDAGVDVEDDDGTV